MLRVLKRRRNPRRKKMSKNEEFKCDDCGSETKLLWLFRREDQVKYMDESERCKKCFDKKFEERYDKNNKK